MPSCTHRKKELITNVCPRSLEPLYIVSYYIKWGMTSLTYRMYKKNILADYNKYSVQFSSVYIFECNKHMKYRLISHILTSHNSRPLSIINSMVALRWLDSVGPRSLIALRAGYQLI